MVTVGSGHVRPLTAAITLGVAAVVAYTAREGISVAAYVDRAGLALTPELAGWAVVALATGDGQDQDAYLLTAAGLRSLN